MVSDAKMGNLNFSLKKIIIYWGIVDTEKKLHKLDVHNLVKLAILTHQGTITTTKSIHSY